ncbi:flippase [Patiriisocius hiemis]|uniref:Flippase n=1 Tax=Patiriisocius hiemis TaxID=3075604 RepID=A0ABU2YCP6_9FLAO|nr:flippase [Constantimarinum sp. W242]MDT0555570.1 flippase [Constantimarinum sp. W242]
MKNTLISSSIRVLALRVGGMFLFFICTLVITNNFDAAIVGEYDFSRALLLFLGAVVLFGMHQAIIYYSGFLKSKNNLSSIKPVYIKMVVVMFIIAVALIVIAQWVKTSSVLSYFDVEFNNTASKTVLTLFFYSITLLNIDVYRALNKIILSEFYRNIIRYLPFLIGVIILYYTNNPEYLIDIFLLNFLFIGVLSTVIVFFFFSRLPQVANKITISFKEIVKRSGPMAISSMSFLLMQSVDVLMLTKFTTYEDVAYYAVTVKLTMVIAIVLSSVNAVIAPDISHLFSASKKEALRRRVQQGTKLIFVLTFPLIIVLALGSGIILKLFGEGYDVAKPALLILLIGQTINALCGSVGTYLNMTGKQVTLQTILVSALAINIVLNYVLIPVYGIVGAAIATSSSMIIWNIIAVIYVYKKDNLKTFLSL